MGAICFLGDQVRLERISALASFAACLGFAFSYLKMHCKTKTMDHEYLDSVVESFARATQHLRDRWQGFRFDTMLDVVTSSGNNRQFHCRFWQKHIGLKMRDGSKPLRGCLWDWWPPTF